MPSFRRYFFLRLPSILNEFIQAALVVGDVQVTSRGHENMPNINATAIYDFPFIGETTAAPPARQAYQLLHLTFFLAPIVAGIDKFLHLLVNWDMYLAPWIASLSPINGHHLMLLVGVVEITAGLIVAFRPRVGAWVVFAWLCAIIVNLLSYPGFYDIALRDFCLALGALALARLSKDYDYSSH